MPGAYYLVRMLDGRIDVQGTVKELRAQGVLDNIIVESTVEVQEKEQQVPAEDKEAKEPTAEAGTNDATKKPRKLVKDEERETGSVKWSIYKTYLKAS